MIDHVDSFRSAMAAVGLDYAGEIIADGTLHEIKANGDKTKKTWYVLHGDGLPAGAFGDHKRGIKEKWCAKADTELTPKERAERDRRWQQQQEIREAERRRQHDAASTEAQKILDAAKPASGDHPYLQRKHVNAHPGVLVGAWPQRRANDCLLIPLRTAAGKLASVQAIFSEKRGDRDKDFLKGGAKAGAFFALGDPANADVIYIAEGYATAASVLDAADSEESWSAIMACDAGNLKPVAQAIRALYPNKTIIVCADNDRATQGNPGLTKATAAAKAIKADLAVPEFAEGEAGSDFNDLAALRGVEAVREALLKAGKPTAAKAEKPASDIQRHRTIALLPGELPENVDAAEAVLCEHEVNFFQRGGQLVRWAASHAETVRGIARPGGAVLILNQDSDYLLDRLNRLICWQRWNQRLEKNMQCDAPRTVATTLLARRGHWQAKPLVAVINSPTLRPDGSILDQPGYDEATGLLFVNNGVEFEPIPQSPTREQALAALAFLKDEVLIGFPFKADHDRSAALSAILTATVRHALKAAPMHTFNAPVMASGKSLLADVAALIATGHPATIMSFTPDGDEMRKRILAVLMQGDLVVNLDNIEEPLANQTLCSVLTQETFTDRILGSNKTGTAPTLCCWQATGNNLVIAGDLTTRIVPCNLDPKVERPEEREFERNLYDWIPANRPRLIREALTVLRAFVVAGKPKQPIKNFARFEDWSGLVRSTLVWLDEADPLTGREAIEDGDPIRVKLRALLMAWHATFKSAPATSREAVCRANETERDEEGTERPCYPVMREALEEHFTDKSGRANSRYLGEFLKKYAGRVEIGARFDANGISHHAVNWRVVIADKSRFAKFTEPGETDSPNSPDSPAPHGMSAQKGESWESGESIRPSPGNFAEKNNVPSVGAGHRDKGPIE
ncbi:MAG: toprim domain-containing protein [Candidatus Competibacter sp.]|jgi:phage/plasmid primase-like uncharacterized protein|nr:toprim domain-containing protein [Candidatus Competibacter sp.]